MNRFVSALLFSTLAIGCAQQPIPRPAAAVQFLPAKVALRPPTGRCPAEFPHLVDVDLGHADLRRPDFIHLSRVCGTAAALQVGGRYQIRGSYRLASEERAQLMVGVTSKGVSENRTTEHQSVQPVTRGSDEFTLELTLDVQGFPHVSFYGRNGSPFGEIYFGAGEWLQAPRERRLLRHQPRELAPNDTSLQIELL